MKPLIYKITNKINNKAYIGKTEIGLKARWKRHKNNARYTNDRKLYRAINKYGSDSFLIEILEYCNVDILNDREIYYIKLYDTFKHGYNMTLGGDGGKYEPSQETKEKISRSNTGRKHTKQAKEKISKAKKGRPNNLICGNKNGFFGKKHSEEFLKYTFESQAKKYEITYEDGSKEIIIGLNKTCLERKWSQGCLARIRKGIQKKPYKGIISICIL